MKRHAILFNRDNAFLFTDLTGHTPSQLLAENDALLQQWGTVVLVKEVYEDGESFVSYVVEGSLFRVSNPSVQLNDHTFTEL